MTVYNLSAKFKWKPTQKDLQRIGLNVKASAKAKGIIFTQVEQKEGDNTYKVYDYPKEFTAHMVVLIKRYWKKQEKISTENAMKAIQATSPLGNLTAKKIEEIVKQAKIK